MRWLPLVLPALLLSGCDQIPALRNILHKRARIEAGPTHFYSV